MTSTVQVTQPRVVVRRDASHHSLDVPITATTPISAAARSAAEICAAAARRRSASGVYSSDSGEETRPPRGSKPVNVNQEKASSMRHRQGIQDQFDPGEEEPVHRRIASGLLSSSESLGRRVGSGQRSSESSGCRVAGDPDSAVSTERNVVAGLGSSDSSDSVHRRSPDNLPSSRESAHPSEDHIYPALRCRSIDEHLNALPTSPVMARGTSFDVIETNKTPAGVSLSAKSLSLPLSAASAASKNVATTDNTPPGPRLSTGIAANAKSTSTSSPTNPAKTDKTPIRPLSPRSPTSSARRRHRADVALHDLHVLDPILEERSLSSLRKSKILSARQQRSVASHLARRPLPSALRELLRQRRKAFLSLGDLSVLRGSNTRLRWSSSSALSSSLRPSPTASTAPVQPPAAPPARPVTPDGLPSFNTLEALAYRLPPPAAPPRRASSLRERVRNHFDTRTARRQWRQQTDQLPLGAVMRGDDGTLVHGWWRPSQSGHTGAPPFDEAEAMAAFLRSLGVNIVNATPLFLGTSAGDVPAHQPRTSAAGSTAPIEDLEANIAPLAETDEPSATTTSRDTTTGKDPAPSSHTTSFVRTPGIAPRNAFSAAHENPSPIRRGISRCIPTRRCRQETSSSGWDIPVRSRASPSTSSVDSAPIAPPPSRLETPAPGSAATSIVQKDASAPSSPPNGPVRNTTPGPSSLARSTARKDTPASNAVTDADLWHTPLLSPIDSTNPAWSRSTSQANVSGSENSATTPNPSLSPSPSPARGLVDIPQLNPPRMRGALASDSPASRTINPSPSSRDDESPVKRPSPLRVISRRPAFRISRTRLLSTPNSKKRKRKSSKNQCSPGAVEAVSNARSRDDRTPRREKGSPLRNVSGQGNAPGHTDACSHPSYPQIPARRSNRGGDPEADSTTPVLHPGLIAATDEKLSELPRATERLSWETIEAANASEFADGEETSSLFVAGTTMSAGSSKMQDVDPSELGTVVAPPLSDFTFTTERKPQLARAVTFDGDGVNTIDFAYRVEPRQTWPEESPGAREPRPGAAFASLLASTLRFAPCSISGRDSIEVTPAANAFTSATPSTSPARRRRSPQSAARRRASRKAPASPIQHVDGVDPATAPTATPSEPYYMLNFGVPLSVGVGLVPYRWGSLPGGVPEAVNGTSPDPTTSGMELDAAGGGAATATDLSSSLQSDARERDRAVHTDTVPEPAPTPKATIDPTTDAAPQPVSHSIASPALLTSLPSTNHHQDVEHASPGNVAGVSGADASNSLDASGIPRVANTTTHVRRVRRMSLLRFFCGCLPLRCFRRPLGDEEAVDLAEAEPGRLLDGSAEIGSGGGRRRLEPEPLQRRY